MERIDKIKSIMGQKEIDLAIIHNPLEIFYFTGNMVQGMLFIPLEEDPVLFIRRPKERPIKKTLTYQYIDRLGEILSYPLSWKNIKQIGVEKDITTLSMLERIKKILPHGKFEDISLEIRSLRMIKDKEEINKIRKAGKIIDSLFAKAKDLINEGITERDLALELEYISKQMGNIGIYRMRNKDNETSFAHILSGANTLVSSYLDAPTGGMGISSAFPQGPSHRKFKKGEPIGIDIMINYDGYIADATRTFVIGEIPDKLKLLNQKLMEIFSSLKENLIPGNTAEEVALKALETAKKLGVDDIFMGIGRDRVKFIGHGVGLEVDEFPFIMKGFKISLRENVVVAVEPKLMDPELGMVGIENTFLITEKGPESLIEFEEDLIRI
ncbi:MAG: hypothetical protein DRQ03_07200 [Candidatus Hydrothermota bacterium]|nr:MAG: hypothetical protein DRQ03_07200 [Candidatus Hydrothermae bacterium]